MPQKLDESNYATWIVKLVGLLQKKGYLTSGIRPGTDVEFDEDHDDDVRAELIHNVKDMYLPMIKMESTAKGALHRILPF